MLFLNQCCYAFSAVRAVLEETISNNVYSNSVHLQKPPKFHRREDEPAKRRQTIAVPDEVAEAIASRSMARRGRVGIQRESSMKLPPSSGQQEAQSELAQAFSRFRRRASEIAQSSQTMLRTEQNREAEVPEFTKKPPKPVHSIFFPSKNLACSDNSQPGLSQPDPVWKSMSSLASDKNITLKPPSVTTSQNLQPTKDRVTTNTKKPSVALANSSPDSSRTNAQECATCVKNPADSVFAHSAEMEKCSASCSSVLRSSGKQEIKPAAQHTVANTTSGTQPFEKFTCSHDIEPNGQPQGKSESSSLLQASSPSTNLERTATYLHNQEHPSDPSISMKQTCTSKTTETVVLSTSLMNHKNIFVVEPTSEVDAPLLSAGRQVFTRQKSCPEKTEQHVNSATTPLISKSSDASGEVDVRRSAEGLRSNASWMTDESGNKLEIKLRKSHSIALKPRKSATSADTLPESKSVLLEHKRTTSTIDSSICHTPQQQRDSLLTRQVSAESCDGGISVYQSERAEVVDIRPTGHMEYIQSLKTGKAITEKKLSSVAVTASHCEEPSWLALARQKRQRWTEGSVMEQCYHYV